MEENTSIKTGDLVTFFSEQEEEEGYFCKAHDSAVLHPTKTKECVFKIHPMTQYTARKALKKKTKRKNQPGTVTVGGTSVDEKDAELKQLEEYQDIEDAANETTLIQLEGRDLIYGQIIQLFHPKSNQFLFAKYYNAGHSIVGFRGDGNQKCYFKIAPRGNVSRQDGEKVRQDDLVLLRHEKTGLFLRETNFFNEKGFFEVGLSDTGTSWKLSLSDVEGKMGLNVVKAGEPFRLFHREGGFIKTSTDESSTTFSYKTSTPQSIRSIFEIEIDNGGLNIAGAGAGGRGGVQSAGVNSPSLSFQSTTALLSLASTQSQDIQFGQPFWIKLIGTKYYFSLKPDTPESPQTKDQSSSNSSSNLLGNSSSSITDVGATTTTTNTTSQQQQSPNNQQQQQSSTPIDPYKDLPIILIPESEKYSPHATFCFVSKDQSATTEASVTFGSFVRIQSLSKQWLHFVSDETFHNNGDLVGTKKYFKNDDYQIKQIPRSQMDDYNYVTTRLNKLQNYLNSQGGLVELRKKVTVQEVRTILVELIKFCTQSDLDALEREGTPIKTHQNLLASPFAINTMLDLLSRFFSTGDRRQEFPLIGYVYRLLKLIVKSNIKNAIAIHKHFRHIAGPIQLRSEMIAFGLGSILLDIYRNNNILLGSITEDKVSEFIDNMKLTKDPRYMELLSEICHCNGHPIVKNQQYLCSLLLEKNPQLMMRTRVTQNVEIEVDGSWMTMAEFMSRGREDRQRYFEQSLALYANVSRGRNYNGIRLIGNFASYKECFLCLKDETLPFGLRGSYTHLVIHVFMDCYPQKPYAKINYLWNPLTMEAPSGYQMGASNTNLSSGGGGGSYIISSSASGVGAGGVGSGSMGTSTTISTTANQINIQHQQQSGNLKTKHSNSTNDLHLMSPNGASQNYGTSPRNLSPAINSLDQDEIFNTFVGHDPIHNIDPSNISQFLMSYVLRPENFSWNNMFISHEAERQRSQWRFFHKILIAVKYAFKFGFFKRKEKLLLNRLRDILEIQANDVADNSTQIDLGRTMGGSRLLEDDSTVLVAIKIEILHILHIMLSLQKKTVFEGFLFEMSKTDTIRTVASSPTHTFEAASVTEANIKKMLATILGQRPNNPPPNTSHHHSHAQRSTMVTHKNTFTNTLFSLLKHENNVLTSLVLDLLTRIYKYQSHYALLSNPVQKLMILSSNVANSIYEQSVRRMEDLTKYCSNPLTHQDTEEVLRILTDFTKICNQEPNSSSVEYNRSKHNQDMFRMMNIHKRLFGVLKMGCSLEDLKDIIDFTQDINTSGNNINISNNNNSNTVANNNSYYVAKIFRGCYEFLRSYCRNNTDNQKILFNYIEFLIGHLIRYGNIFGTVETLMEIFKDNIQLCTKFSETPYMKLLVEFIIQQENIMLIDPVFLKFLQVIMVPGGNSVIEIQVAISNLIKEHFFIVSKWLLPIDTVRQVMQDSKGATMTKFFNVNTSESHRLQMALNDVIAQALQNYDDLQMSASVGHSSGGSSLIQGSISTSATGNQNLATLKFGGGGPKLIRSTAKHMLVNTEILPREFLVNLELIWLLTSCSNGRNVPTEIICREFISMYDCLSILVISNNSNGGESTLLIPDNKENLDSNVSFRFKTTYLSFLHEVYFNSDTLKGDLLALQLNENLWTLISQFTNQLGHLYTCHGLNRMSKEYFLQMSRMVLLPMVSTMERFYSQCFYYDKATPKHLHYSSMLMGSLLKLYSTDDSLPIPPTSGTMSQQNKQSVLFDDTNGSSGGIHPILSNLEAAEKIILLNSLVKLLKAMDRSAISPISTSHSSMASVSEVIRGFEEIIVRLDHLNSKWTRRRDTVTDSHLPSLALVSKQSTYLNEVVKEHHPMIRLVKERGYQQLALMAIERDKASIRHHQSEVMSIRDPVNHYNHYSSSQRDNLNLSTLSNSSTSSSVNGVSKKNTYLEILVFQLRNTLFDNNELKLHCLQVLLSVLDCHPNNKKEMQEQLTEMYCHQACIGLLGSKSYQVQQQALSLLLVLLEGHSDPTNPKPNEHVKEAIQSYFTSSPDIQFFRNIYEMMERAKCNLRDTKRNIRLETFKHNIGGNLSLGARRQTIGMYHERPTLESEIDHNPYSQEFLMMSNIFRVLQLLCQGSSNLFKNYIRLQPDNYKSYDLLKEMCQFLKILETIVDFDPESINLGLRFFSCMKEIVKHTQANQISVTNVQMCKAVCNILRKTIPKDAKHQQHDLYLNLKIEVIDFLLHVVDREHPTVIAKMIEELDFSVIEENTKIFQQSKSEHNEASIKLASMSFRLVKILADNDKSHNRGLAECLLACGEHCRSRIGRVEMFHNGKLERIYFPIPSYSRRLILDDKEQSKIKSDENEFQENLEEYFNNNHINWNKTTEKLDAFMDWSENKLIDLEHLYKLKSQPLAYRFATNMGSWRWINFILACIINILLIIYSVGPAAQFEQDFGRTRYYGIIYPLGILQLLFSVMTCVSYFIRFGSIILFRGWMKYLGNERSYMLKTNHERMQHIRSSSNIYKFLALNCFFISSDAKSVYYLLAIVFSVLGITISPFFFAFHLFQITVKTKALGIVIKALAMNKGTLLLMGVFIIQATYLLSIFSYAFFDGHYQSSDGQKMCNTFFQCFITNIYYGIPSNGQLVQFLEYYQFGEYNDGAGSVIAWTIFNVIFYIITTIILLNVVLGIIVDTFGQLRDQRSQTEDYKTNFCFICSIEREVFQKKGIDFHKHVEDDHNKWYYLYFFAYLKERVINNQQNQFSDSELNALHKIENNNSLSLFPIETSMSLLGENNDSTKMMNAIQELEQRITSSLISQMNTTISALLEEIKVLRQHQQVIK